MNHYRNFANKRKTLYYAFITTVVIILTIRCINMLMAFTKNSDAVSEKYHLNEKLDTFFNFAKDQTSVMTGGCQTFDENTSHLLNELLLNPKIVPKKERESLGLKDLAVVSFSSLNHMNEAVRSCDSFQQNPSLKNTPFLMYLDNDVPESIKDIYSKLCPIAEIIPLNLSNYPKYVQDLPQYRFKAVYQALTLKKYKVTLNIDSSIRFNKSFNFSDLISDVIQNNPTDVTLLSSNGHNMFSVTHPKMFECFPNINITATQQLRQFKGGLTLWIGSERGWKIMKRFATCALHPECMGPTGSTQYCDGSRMTKYPHQFSGCHRYDQSAINFILLEESNYRPTFFQRQSIAFKVRRDSKID